MQPQPSAQMSVARGARQFGHRSIRWRAAVVLAFIGVPQG